MFTPSNLMFRVMLDQENDLELYDGWLTYNDWLTSVSQYIYIIQIGMVKLT